MEKFERYLAAIDGTARWDDVEGLFEDLFHPDLVVVTADGEMNRDQWAEMTRGLLARNARVTDIEITAGEDDTIHYQLTIDVGDDDPLQMRATGTIRDGRLARVEPLNPDAYSEMVDRSR